MTKFKKETPQQRYRKEQQEAKLAQQKRIQRITIFTGAGITVLIIAVVLFSLFSPEPEPLEENPFPIFAQAIPETADLKLSAQPSMGDPGASVEVVEFADFQCPHCREFHVRYYERVKHDYIDKGKIRYYFVGYPVTGINAPIPFNTAAFKTAQAAECMYREDSEAFWQLYDALFIDQVRLRNSGVSPESIEDLLRDKVRGAYDREAVMRCFSTGSAASEIESDVLIADAAGVEGTPTIIVNRHIIDWNGNKLFDYIDRELSH